MPAPADGACVGPDRVAVPGGTGAPDPGEGEVGRDPVAEAALPAGPLPHDPGVQGAFCGEGETVVAHDGPPGGGRGQTVAKLCAFVTLFTELSWIGVNARLVDHEH
ncbi:hypothetical protein GCM10025792_23390 [Pseudonocardia tropica]